MLCYERKRKFSICTAPVPASVSVSVSELKDKKDKPVAEAKPVGKKDDNLKGNKSATPSAETACGI